MVKKNYDGYRFNDKEIFCPWDIVCFIKDAHIKKQAHEDAKIVAENYWTNTSSSTALLSYVGYLSDQENSNLQKLMDGFSIETTINEQMNYDDLKMHRSEDFFSLLLQTGYLTKTCQKQSSSLNKDIKVYSLKIPNLEIRECFASNIMQHFNDIATKDQNLAQKLSFALLQGNKDKASEYIHSLLQSYVSIRDFATKARPENFYHGFISGVLSNCGKFITDFKSNKEAGLGYADICFKNEKMDQAVLIELKATNNKSAVKKEAQDAISQIIEKQYAQEYINDPFIKGILCYGLAFYKKQCWIEVKKLQ